MAFLFIFDLAWLIILYILSALIFGRIIRNKFLFSYIINLMRQARKQKNILNKISEFGLAIFVWTPLPLTGAVIGTFLGLLVGFSPKKTFSIVVPSMLIGVISWTYGFSYLTHQLNKIDYFWGAFLLWGVFILSILFQLGMNLGKNKET
ncbi:small multi-drug export protein [bacterium]